jgi:hypothetical protein
LSLAFRVYLIAFVGFFPQSIDSKSAAWRESTNGDYSMISHIIDFDRYAGRVTPAMNNRRVQRRASGLVDFAALLANHPSTKAKAREPDSLPPSERDQVLQFVKAYQAQPHAIAQWIVANATEAGLATLISPQRLGHGE